MILPPHQAKNVTHFQTDHVYGVDKQYNSTCHDVYTVHFSKMKSFLGFKIFEYRKEWKKDYKFTRTRTDDNDWKITPDSSEFSKQMKMIQDDQWVAFDPDVYNKIVEEHPEYFL